VEEPWKQPIFTFHLCQAFAISSCHFNNRFSSHSNYFHIFGDLNSSEPTTSALCQHKS
jgi:hypothetical protein